MVYECLIDKRNNKFIGAHPAPAIWGTGETQWPFEIGISEDIEFGIFDRPVRIHWSKGVLEVMASTISESITREEMFWQEKRLQEMCRRQYPINAMTIQQPIKVVGRTVGDLK